MAEAEARELIEFNPIGRIKRIGTGYTPRDAFTAADLALLFPSERHKQLAIWGGAVWLSFFRTLATTGLRSGEARALRWGDVLWDRAALVVVRAVKADNSIGSTKTGDGRVVLLLGQTLETLSWWRDQSPTTDPEHYVFLDDRRPIRRDQIRAHLLPAMAAAELKVEGRRLSAHSFRHGFNTMLARAVDAATLRAMTGHRTQAMTDHYDHPLIEDSLRALEPSRGAVEKAIGGNHGEA
jgi:integrase